MASKINHDNHYGAINEDAEQEVAWNEEERRASILNNSSGRHSSSRRSLRESFAGSLQQLGQSIRSSQAGSLIRQSITLSLPGRQCSVRDMGGTATIPTEFFNLVKNLVGAGMLAIPVRKLDYCGYGGDSFLPY